MTKRFQFRHVNELTGLFVLIILVGVALALFFAARSQHWFAARIEYQLQLPPSGASGLKPGDEVVVLGLPAGLVKDVTVSPSGRLDAHITLRRDLAQFIRADTRATIKKVFGVAGDSFVELSRGTVGEPLKKDAMIPCESSEELPTVVDRLLEEVRGEVLPIAHKAGALLDQWSQLGTNLNTSQAELQMTLERLNRITAHLEAGQGTAGRLLTDTNVMAQGEQVLMQSQAALAELQIVLKQLKAGTAALPDISQAVAAETRDLPGLILQAQQTAGEMQRLTEALERHWLIRSYVEPRADGGRIPSEQIPGGTP